MDTSVPAKFGMDAPTKMMPHTSINTNHAALRAYIVSPCEPAEKGVVEKKEGGGEKGGWSGKKGRVEWKKREEGVEKQWRVGKNGGGKKGRWEKR